jgi:octaprenyl-diphosphate synthase
MIIEAIHLSSLLHDDVVDGSELRRGVATMNAQHSNKISVLFGDHIFISAFKMANELGNPEAVRIVHRAVKRMVEGEIRDTLSTNMIDEETYFRIISDKTASLFAASGELAIILSGVDGVERIWARELGESVGIAFQIIDDTLDYNGNRDKMGKPVFMDVMSENMTLPLIHSLRDITVEERDKILADRESSVERLTELVMMNGGIEYAYQKANDYFEKAREIVSRFNNKNVQIVFSNFFDLLMERHF